MSDFRQLDSFTKQLLNLAENQAEERVLQDSVLDMLTVLDANDLLPFYLELRAFLKQHRHESLLHTLEDAETRIEALVYSRIAQMKKDDGSLQEARESVLAHEFPEVKKMADEDIGKYFHARSQQDMRSAQVYYQKLIFKYPYVEERSNLLRWHRTGKSLFALHFRNLRNALADRVLDQVRKTVLYLLRCFTESGAEKAWDLLPKIRAAVKILPADKAQAAKVLERMLAYSEKLAFHFQEFSSICELLEDFFGDNLFARHEIKLVLPKNLETSRSEKPKARVQTFEIDKLEFSAQDLREILINPQIKGLENITLTYCHHYWQKAFDAAFESKVSLYSLRYHTVHNAIFQAIKIGQSATVKDEDILYAIYNILAKDSPYEYNVRKDIYMQSVWRRIKPGQGEKPIIEDTRAFAESEIQKAKILRAQRRQRADEVVRRVRVEKTESRNKAALSVERQRQVEAAVRAKAEKRVVELRELERKSKERAADKARLARDAQRPSKLHPVVSGNLQTEWTRYDGTEQEVVPIRERVEALEQGGEKNLHHIFRSRLESEIQNFVQELIDKENLEIKNVQKTLAVLAIKDFLQNHYEKRNRSWVLSNERLKVKELGLNLQDVEPIIERCLSGLKEAVAAV